MANTLTGILPVLYEALDTVSREMVGFIPSVRKDTSAKRAGKDQTIRIPVAPAATLEAVTPGAAPAESGSQTIGYTDVSINKVYAAPILWNGEEEMSLKGGNFPIKDNLIKNQFEQAFRALTNQIEEDLGGLYIDASRAFGTAGTTPFATANQLDDISYAKKILQDNGAPMSDLHLVMDTTAGAKLGGFQSVLFKVNESGSENGLRNGEFGKVNGMELAVSAGVQDHTSGTASGAYTLGDTSYPVGTKNILLASVGNGTLLPGDVVIIDGDSSERYVVDTGSSAVSGDSFNINAPGVITAIGDTQTVSAPADYTANMAFDRNAIVLVTRAPASPEGGDMADDIEFITDPVSGLVFEICLYRQYKQIKIEVGLAWGYKVVKPEHVAIMLG